jgi:hypothetical protein
MTKDEILSMASQAGIVALGDVHIELEELERFAALVAEKTTEQANAAREINFCERCGKRAGDYIHTCTPPELSKQNYKGARLVLTDDGVKQDGWMGDK